MYAEEKSCIGNIDAKKLIVSQIWYCQQQHQFADDRYNKATLNHNYGELRLACDDKLYFIGEIKGLKTALRYCLAQEASASGRLVSADLSQFDEVIEEMISGKQ